MRLTGESTATAGTIVLGERLDRVRRLKKRLFVMPRFAFC